ncbi:MAG: helix-turn-helix domain-containing protein [Candidatus Norongarragalinales archaeon]
MNYSDAMTANPEILNSLRQLGLNQYEAKAYYALANFGVHTAGELAERAELPRPRIYDVLTELQNKGFVLIQQGRPVKYAALPIGEAVKTLAKQRQAGLQEELEKIEDIGKKLSLKIKTQSSSALSSEETIWTLKGREAIYSKISSMIANAKQHVTIATDEKGWLRKSKAHGKEIDKAAKRGADITVIAPIASVGVQEATHLSKELPSRMVLADDQALLFLSPKEAKAEEEMALWLKNPHFVQTFRQTIK